MVNFKAQYLNRIFVVFLALTLLLGGFGFSGTAAASRGNFLIIGGHAASQSYPGMASLQVSLPGDPNFHLCGATLVSRRYVATNAHCVTYDDGSAVEPDLFHLRIGSPNRLKGGVSVGVSEVLPHADWDWGIGNNPVADIALLRLDDYVQLQPFEIAPHLGDPGAVTRILGWGSTEPSGEGPGPLNLQELDTKLIKPQNCANAGISAGEICVNSPNGTDGSCYGDSGSPALQKVTSSRWSVIGSVSRAGTTYCATGGTVYTDLTYYRNWMYAVMRTGVVPPSTTSRSTAKPYKSVHYNWTLPAQYKAGFHQR